jgi:hypothetical protein
VKFEDARKFIEEYVDHTDFRPTYNMIMSHIDSMMKNQTLEKFDPVAIKNGIRKLYFDFFNHHTEFEYLRFIEACSEMIYNWNSNTTKDADIEVYASTLKKLVGIVMNMQNSIQAMKAANEKFKRLRPWQPPVHDITLAYLDSLMKQSENK